MFTGIIECVGEVESFVDSRLVVVTPFEEIVLGESIAVDGVCLTVSGWSANSLQFDLAEETVRRTTLGRAAAGMKVNLERAMKVGDRLGGHIMQGHVDGVATISQVERLGTSSQVT